ncbi:MAG: 50S ribosomal protein L11 methyltransferase, partial [Deltaproteobacteria bacterium]|nr:50S ribosomal protein L11 methyltransferase [Deltaproteobacteria bacterium]
MTQSSCPNSGHPGWIEITIDIDPDAGEAVSDFLMGLGCNGVVSEDFESSLLKAYLTCEGNEADIVRKTISMYLDNLKGFFPDIADPVVNIKVIANQDWGTTWRRFFSLEKITDNLMILPVWEPTPENHTSHVIRIDPGPAFGTGKHETTRMCLKAIEDSMPNRPWNMLDVGTGSGILSVFGAMLGAYEITAIDNDPVAVEWAQRNIALNDLPVKIDLSITPLDRIDKRYDLIAANLVMNTILELNPLFSDRLAAHGVLILSGLLTGQVETVEKGLG